MSVQTKVELSGQFFTRDPGKTLRANIRDMLDGLAGEMESQVRGEVQAHAGSMPNYTGWTADHIVGRTHSLGGMRWGLTAVVSANSSGMSAAEAIRTKAAAASIERRWHPFRGVRSAVYRSRAVIGADLTRGLE